MQIAPKEMTEPDQTTILSASENHEASLLLYNNLRFTH